MSPEKPTGRNEIKSEVFRFVNVRAPKNKVSTKQLNGIAYESGVYKKVSHSLYHQYIQVKKKGADADNFKKGISLIQKYKSTSNFINDTAALNEVYLGYIAFYDWCSETKTLDKKIIREKLLKTTKKNEIELTKEIEKQSIAWDNYFIQASEQSNTYLLDDLTTILRVYAISKELNSDSALNLERLERIPVVIPKEILLINFEEIEGERIVEQNNDVDSQLEIPKKLSTLIGTKNELTSIFKSYIPKQLEQESDEDKESLSYSTFITKINSFNEDVFEQLSDISKGLVKDLGIKPNSNSFSIIFELIDLEINRLNADLIASTNIYKKLVVIGNSIVEYSSDNQKSAAKNNPKYKSATSPASDDPFVSIYNCVFQQDKQKRLNISIGDFMRVEQELKCYVPGEIAHIENVLKGEEKVHETRRFERSEDRYSYETSSTSEEERDVQTTNRFEMEKASERVINTDSSLEAGVDISAKYGSVRLNSNMGFSSNISTSEATRSASNYAKNVTERARNMVSKSIKESRSSTSIKEFEDKNTHTLKAIDNHTVGIYRWVDKIYKTRLINYGKRLMIRFDLLEPSAYHIYATLHANDLTGSIRIPIHPSEVEIENQRLSSYQDIDENNYGFWAAAYNARVPVPPKKYVFVGTSIEDKKAEDIKRTSERISIGEDENLIIPAGYSGKKVYVRADFASGATPGGWPMAQVNVGNSSFFFSDNPTIMASQRRASLQIDGNFLFEHFNDNKVPINYASNNTDHFRTTIVLQCEVNFDKMNEWKTSVYQAIMEAYDAQKYEAENKLAQLKAMADVPLSGNNPLKNAVIIENNLKRLCIENLRAYNTPIGEHLLPYNYDRSNTSMLGNWGQESVLANPFTAIPEGKYINFVEQCFEWSQMTYQFHPFYWARKNRWTKLYNLTDSDPLFNHFLSAGSASVVVPVNVGFEKQLMYFIQTGKLWLSAETPVIDSELDNYINSELSNIVKEEPIVESCWDTRLPTDLVILQNNASGIDEDGLPCYELTCEG